MNMGTETYIWLDTHRETIHGTALDKNGEIICSVEFPNNKKALTEFMKDFPTWNTVKSSCQLNNLTIINNLNKFSLI